MSDGRFPAVFAAVCHYVGVGSPCCQRAREIECNLPVARHRFSNIVRESPLRGWLCYPAIVVAVMAPS